MAENNNKSNDNGGADDEILAAIQSHITKAKSREACYVFGDVIKDPMKAIYGDKWRAVVAKKSHNDADLFVRMNFPAGPGKYSYPSVEAGKDYLMAKTTKNGAPYWNPPLLDCQICVTSCQVLEKACASFKSPTPAAVSMAAAPTASPPPPKTEGKIPKKADIVIDASPSPSSVAGAEPMESWADECDTGKKKGEGGFKLGSVSDPKFKFAVELPKVLSDVATLKDEVSGVKDAVVEMRAMMTSFVQMQSANHVQMPMTVQQPQVPPPGLGIVPAPTVADLSPLSPAAPPPGAGASQSRPPPPSLDEFKIVVRGLASGQSEDAEIDKLRKFLEMMGKADLYSNIIGYERPTCREFGQLTHYQKNALTLFLSFSSAQAMQEFVTDVVPCMNEKHPIGKSMVCPVHNRGGKVVVNLFTKRARM